MAKNGLFAVANLFVFTLPILLTWDVWYYLGTVLLFAAFFGLLCWNRLGVWCIVKHLFKGQPLPANAEMKPELDKYVASLRQDGLIQATDVSYYWTEHDDLWFMPLTAGCYLVDLKIEDKLCRKGAALLESTPAEHYQPAYLTVRRYALLSLLGYSIILRFMQLWGIFFIICVRAICALVGLIVTGFGTTAHWFDAIFIGWTLGGAVAKLNDYIGVLEGKLVDFAIHFMLEMNKYNIDDESRVA